jgi:hypothetical protein
MEYIERLKIIINTGFSILSEKISHGLVNIDNESSFQLQYGFILKTLGSLYEFSKNDSFSIMLENYLEMNETFRKSGTNKARIDILLKFDVASEVNPIKTYQAAIELKYFKKENHREPNNRYDVFRDISNLEKYKNNGIDVCCFILATDHSHYCEQKVYSPDTSDFNFTDGVKYQAGQVLTYRTEKPYGAPITLNNSYEFNWNIINDKYFLKLDI